MSVDPAVLTGLVRVAFDKVNSRDVLRMRTSPVDAHELVKRVAQLGITEQISIVGDPTLARGALVLDTQQGQVDASVDAQLEEIERGLTDALDRGLS
jgi:flagellar assembly protein FliH